MSFDDAKDIKIVLLENYGKNLTEFKYYYNSKIYGLPIKRIGKIEQGNVYLIKKLPALSGGYFTFFK